MTHSSPLARSHDAPTHPSTLTPLALSPSTLTSSLSLPPHSPPLHSSPPDQVKMARLNVTTLQDVDLFVFRRDSPKGVRTISSLTPQPRKMGLVQQILYKVRSAHPGSSRFPLLLPCCGCQSIAPPPTPHFAILRPCPFHSIAHATCTCHVHVYTCHMPPSRMSLCALGAITCSGRCHR